jgi:hypothetical protein
MALNKHKITQLEKRNYKDTHRNSISWHGCHANHGLLGNIADAQHKEGLCPFFAQV